MCVHWAVAGGDRSTTGAVDATEDAIRRAWHVEVTEHGLRRPLQDGGGPAFGGNKALDIYLTNLQGETFGSCESDDPASISLDEGRVWAFCVLDNDYRESEYRSDLSSGNARKLTIAHELFHAIQMAYDFSEPAWMTEGTAVWIEDAVFDGINDNYQYLWHSPVQEPALPIDSEDAGDDDPTPYGRWIFWRFLDERFSPALVRRVWQRAGQAGIHGVEAVGSALVEVNETWNRIVRDFAVSNYLLNHPQHGYEEGNQYLQFLGGRPPLDAEFRLTREPPHSTIGPRSISVPRKAGRYISFKLPRDTGLSVGVTVPVGDIARVTLIVFRPTGGVVLRHFSSAVTVQNVDRAILVLPNGGDSSTEFSYEAEVAL